MKRAMIHTLLALMVLGGNASAATAQEAVRPVKLIEMSAGSQDVTRKFFGQVVARQTVDLAFQVTGQIIEFPVLEGQIIAQGDLVAQLDLDPFELQLDQARVQLEQAQRNLNRFEQLSGSTVSQVTVDDARTQVELAEIAVRNAEYALKHATVDAPFDALVATRSVANFTTVGVGTPVVRLHDMSELRIEIDIPEILFQRAGQNPDVRLTAQFPASSSVYPLVIREYDAQASVVGQTFRLTLALLQPEDLAIVPGSSVTVEARLHGEVTPPVLPTSAVHVGNDGQTYAMVFLPADGDEGTIEMRAVALAAGRDGAFRVVEGLEPGELVVLTGVSDLSDGQSVRRFIGFEK